MAQVTGIEIKEVESGKVKNKRNRRAPRKVIEALREAGVVSFNCKELDWNVIRRDAEALATRLGVKVQNR